MVKLSVCIEMFWRGMSEIDKIKKVKDIGYSAFEFWGWKNKDIEGIKKVKEELGMEIAAICNEPNFCLTTDDISFEQLLNGFKETTKIAKKLECKRIIITTGNIVYGESFEITRRKVIKKLKEMSKIAEDNNLILLLEPLNPIIDHKGYWLTKTVEAVDIIEEINSHNLKILYDIYHQQLTEGNIINTITKYINLIGHFHSAGIPGRHELIGGELDYSVIFNTIKKLNYEGYIGLEFSPLKSPEDSLRESLKLL